MTESFLVSLIFALIQNVALLVAFIVLFGLVLKIPYLARIGLGRMVSGTVLMFIGIGIMSTPFYLSEGIVFDTRTVLLSASGLFFGGIPTLIAAIGTSAYRIQLGGDGVIPGILTIITSGMVGLLWRNLWQQKLSSLQPRHLYLFGLTAHLPMAIIIASMLGHAGAEVYWIITPCILLLYPLASMLIAYLLLQRLHEREQIEQQKAIAIALTEAKEAAESASRAKSDFLAVISHELMTPLNHIIGPSEMVAEQLNDKDLKQLMQIVLGGSRQLKQHFERLLAFAEIERRSHADCWTGEDIRGFLEEESESFRLQLSEKGLALEFDIDESVPKNLHADYALLHTVLENLLENAVKFATRGPVKIAVSAIDAQSFKMVIEDQGPGISDPEKVSVFLPFQQRDMSLCRTNQGIGIGLALCQRLTKARDADLKLEDSEHGGCRFTLTFPASEEARVESSSSAA
jgi:signal transduction histidine kinase